MFKEKKIAFVLRTVGLEYDDRVRKEALALSKYAEVFIYVNFADNREEEGVTDYGIPYKSFKLFTRDKLPSAKYLLIKAFEFFLKVRPHLKKYDMVWAHEEYAFMFPLLLKKRFCIWDLHEIPFRFQRKYMKSLFKKIEKKSIFLLHANKYRIQYLRKEGLIQDNAKHLYLNNFPDSNFVESNEVHNKDENYEDFIKWLDKDKYVYLQGLMSEGRFPYNTIKSILSTDLKMLVVGSFDEQAMNALKNEYGDEILERVYFMGMINQLFIPAYLSKAEYTVILYNTDTPNNKYCEPNRLYQSISLSIPILVGNNPPMKSIVEEYDIGISLMSDGRDLEELTEKIGLMQKRKKDFKSNLKKYANKFLWNDEDVYKLFTDNKF